MTKDHEVVSRSEWIQARKQLLAEEKQLTHLRERLSEKRRQLPWVRVDESYMFDGPNGQETMAQLFEGRSQLVVYHFMFDPDWEEGCKSCSFWADNFNGIVDHLKHRDVTMIAVSRAPLAKLSAYAKRLGWSFKWVSSSGNTFNYDYRVSFTPEEIATGEVKYNYGTHKAYGADLPGISVFFKDPDGSIFHTYSSYARGIDMMNTAYHYLDLVPKGRDEQGAPMSWLRRRDQYAR